MGVDFGHYPMPNVGSWDRTIRFIVGILVGAYGIFMALQGMAIWPIVAILASIYPMLTSLMGWDPIYQFFAHKPKESGGIPSATGHPRAP